MTSLDQLRPGTIATVHSIAGSPALVQRLYELGLLEGDQIEVVRFAPMGDPMEIRVANTFLSVRRTEAAGVICLPQ